MTAPSSVECAGIPALLSDEDTQHFIREGYVILRGLLPEELVRSTRDALFAELETEEGRRQSPRSGRSTQAMWGAGPLTRACRSSLVERVAAELVGPHFLPQISVHRGKEQVGLPAREEGFIPVLTHPLPNRVSMKKEFVEPDGWHVDGTCDKTLLPQELMIVVFAYLTDVSEYGGATTVKPGSHRQLFEHWHQNGVTPIEELTGRFAPSKPLAGKAGDVIFFHYLLVHSGSDNLDDHIRLGLNTAVHQDPEHPYQLPVGAPSPYWTPFDWTLRTDNL